MVVAALEMDGEFRRDLGQAVATSGFEDLADGLVQPPACPVGDLLVDHFMMQRMEKLVQPDRGGVFDMPGHGQEQLRSDQLLRDRLYGLDVTADGAGHRPRCEGHAGHAGRLQDGALVGPQAVELQRDHFGEVVGHLEI